MSALLALSATPLGVYSRFYTGSGNNWIYNYAGGDASIKETLAL